MCVITVWRINHEIIPVFFKNHEKVAITNSAHLHWDGLSGTAAYSQHVFYVYIHLFNYSMLVGDVLFEIRVKI